VPDDKNCELESIVEQIKNIVGDKLDKFEKDIKESMNELKVKVDEVHMKQSTQSERLNSIEAKVATCDTSRVEQGKRLGEVERDFAIFKAVQASKETTTKEIKTENTGFIRWLPSVIFGICALVFTVLNFIM